MGKQGAATEVSSTLLIPQIWLRKVLEPFDEVKGKYVFFLSLSSVSFCYRSEILRNIQGICFKKISEAFEDQ